MTMSIWVFLLIISLALLTGSGARPKVAAGLLLVTGFILGATHADGLRGMLDQVADLFS